VSNVAGRERAAEVLASKPDASLREVARLAGVSPATVSDVRSRLARGEAPAGETKTDPRTPVRTPAARPQRRPDPALVLDKLLRDPSLRNNEEGRNLLRLLRNNAIGMQQWADLAAAVPPHCGGLVVQLAQRYAELWLEFSRELDERVQSVTGEVVDASRHLLTGQRPATPVTRQPARQAIG
jgi:transposase-like protein